jgi:hypothetical protein
VKANRAYDLLVRRGAAGPAFLAGPDATDRVEVVDIATGEPVLLWDVPVRQSRRVRRALRADLAQLEADAFLARWRRRP